MARLAVCSSVGLSNAVRSEVGSWFFFCFYYYFFCRKKSTSLLGWNTCQWRPSAFVRGSQTVQQLHRWFYCFSPAVTQRYTRWWKGGVGGGMEFSAVNPSCSGYRWSSCWGLGFRYWLVPDSRRVRRKPNGHWEKVHIGRAGPFCC